MKKILFIILCLLLITLTIGGVYVWNIYNEKINIDTIYKGISIDGIQMGGLKKEEAIIKIKQHIKSNTEDKGLTINAGDKKYEIGLDHSNYSYNVDEIIDKAYIYGRKGSLIDRYKLINGAENGINFELTPSYDSDFIDGFVDNISNDLDSNPVDAKFSFNEGKFLITSEIIGQKLNKADLKQAILLYLENPFESENVISAEIETVNPEKTEKFYSKMNGIIGEYSTSFQGSAEGRIENIKLSTKALSNIIIMPGEEVSFNKITGNKNKANGYQLASVLLGNKYVPGYGGGVCQTSTTLYNALIKAGVKIVERSPHSIPATYAPLGLDAAVADGALDLKFVNEYDFPIYTYGEVSGNNLSIYIYGDAKSKKHEYKFTSEIVAKEPFKTIEVIDNNLQDNTKEVDIIGRNGFRVVSYKHTYMDNKLISTEVLNRDRYPVINQVVKVGAGNNLNEMDFNEINVDDYADSFPGFEVNGDESGY